MEYLALTFGSFLLAGDFALNKLYQRIYGTKLKAAFLFNALSGLFAAAIFFVVNGCKLDITPFSVLMASLMCILAVTYSILGFQLLKSGSLAVYTLFLMSGGMVLPYVWGILFLHEPFSWLRLIGLLAITAGVVLPNLGHGKLGKQQLLLCLAVFVLNGFVSITSKMHQINTASAISTTDFIIWQGLIKFFLAGGIFLFARRKESSPDAAPMGKAVLITVGSAALSGSFSLIQLTIAATLPASVLYPFNTGLTIGLSAVAGVIFFRDKLSRRSVLGILLCFIGTLLFV